VDDTLLFMEASEEQARVIHDVLRRYEIGTGQLINPSKCSVMFGADCQMENQEKVMAILKAGNIAKEEKYLGLLTPEGRMKKERFKSIKERLSSRFSNWAERYMLGGAKEVLIKSVAQAIPTYVMGGF
jgi:hypothetical protein